jgi:hypothetical protein
VIVHFGCLKWGGGGKARQGKGREGKAGAASDVHEGDGGDVEGFSWM